MVEEITPEAVKQRLDRGDEFEVIDIRDEETFQLGHIPGAENLPFYRFVSEVETRAWGDEIVVVCPMGESSLQAARLLESYEGVGEDATIFNMEGGYSAWEYDLEGVADEEVSNQP